MDTDGYLERVEAQLLRWKTLGEKILPNGTRLIGHVPRVGANAWLHVIFSPPAHDQVQQLQEVLTSRVPPEYMRLLERFNGLTTFSGRLCIYGLRTSYSRRGDEMWQPYDVLGPNTTERVPRAPADAFFVGTHPRAGLRYALMCDSGAVIECSRDDPSPIRRWSSLSEMIEKETTHLTTIFGVDGYVNQT